MTSAGLGVNFEPKIRMDDWRRSVDELVPAANAAAAAQGDQIAAMFLRDPVIPFAPVPAP
jgi:hypothetical protein